MTNETNKTLLDEITMKLSRLDRDNLLCVAINAIVANERRTPSGVVSHLIHLVVTVSALMDREEKIKCINNLRDAADLYENGLREFEKLN